ncbi:MAG: DNA repair protein RecO C-terminal domain-containing protein [Bacteriovoracaceae bacterium]|nr:DNA repair protein RecO C-terminal domain-containing protein [Bacteriovoracaceae bacterium]
MALEGIVIQIIPQKERDLIARFLLREGTTISVYVFGGMGGGKNSKPRVFEPGNLLKFELRRSQSGHASGETLGSVSEHTLMWQAKNIRHDAKGFALACLYMEMILKTALPHQGEDINAQSEHGGLFNVLSNGLFYLDQSLEKKNLIWENHLLLFLSKFLLHLGVLPDESECVYCGSSLELEACAPLILEQGGFTCENCLSQIEESVETNLPLRALLSQAVRTKFQEWEKLPQTPQTVNVRLIQFWCYQFQVRLPEVMSYKLLF